MQPLTRLIGAIRAHYHNDPDLLRTVINSASWFEASLAMTLARDAICEKHLTYAANIRESIRELPRCPLTMPTDFETLAGIWALERAGHGWERECEDPDGCYTIVLLGEGNHCYDIVVRADGLTHMWMPFHEGDYVNPVIIDLLFERVTLLPVIVELVAAMGLAFSPLFYLSLDDWHQEYAETMYGEVADIFGEPLKGLGSTPASALAAVSVAPVARAKSAVIWTG